MWCSVFQSVTLELDGYALCFHKLPPSISHSACAIIRLRPAQHHLINPHFYTPISIPAFAPPPPPTFTAISMTSNIKVCVRVRPLFPQEEQKNSVADESTKSTLKPAKRSVFVMDEEMIIFDPSEEHKKFMKGVPTHENKRVKDLKYVFDGVFDENSSQQHVSVFNYLASRISMIQIGVNVTF